MKLDRYTLLHGLRSAALREWARRQAILEARVEEAREWLNSEYDRMAQRLGLEPSEESDQVSEP